MPDYTTGDWTHVSDGYVEAGGRAICEVAVYGDRRELTEEDMANARLIAAAPDLLEACKKARKEIKKILAQEEIPPEINSAWTKLDSVIKEAT